MKLKEYEVLKTVPWGAGVRLVRVATLHAHTAEQALQIAKRKGFIIPIIGEKDPK
jgi:hypothetical protein